MKQNTTPKSPSDEFKNVPNHSEFFLEAIRELEDIDFLDADSKMLILVTANKTKPASEISVNNIPGDKVEETRNTLESIFRRLGLYFTHTTSKTSFNEANDSTSIRYELASSEENLDRLIAAYSEENWIDGVKKTGHALGFPPTAIDTFIEQSRKGIWNIDQRREIQSRIPEEERRFMSFVPSEGYFTSGEQDYVMRIIEDTRNLSPGIYNQLISEDRTSVLEQLKRERAAQKDSQIAL